METKNLTTNNFIIITGIFSFFYWFDFFISLGKMEINPLYSPTAKLIFFPIIITSVLLMKKFWSNKMKLPLIFLVSLFAFAFVWNIGGVYAQTVLVDRTDASHQAGGAGFGGGRMIQIVPTDVHGSSLTQFDWFIGCSAGTYNVTYAVVRIDGTGTSIDSLLAFNNTIIIDSTPSTVPQSNEIYNFTFGTPVQLPSVVSERYAILVNASNITGGTTVNGCAFGAIGTLTRSSGTDTAGENSKGILSLTSNYVGSTITGSSPTSAYRLLGVNAIYSNQTSTSTCNALNGASCTSTTPALTYENDCSFNFLAILTHNINLFNGSIQTQTATATSEFILPASNQFSNVTIVDWTNQTSRNLNLTFSKTNYGAGDTVQARCSLNMNSINSTSGISTCTLATSCLRVLESTANDTIQANPTSLITEAGANQILEFFLSPFMIMTMLAFAIAGLITVSMGKFMQGHGGVVFVSILFVMFFAYVFLGVYPLFVGIIMILVVGLILTKMVLGFFKGD